MAEPRKLKPREEGPMCPECHCFHLPVYRTIRRRRSIIRIRYCRNCSRRVVTSERIEAEDAV